MKAKHAGGAIAICVGLVGGFEGLQRHAYQDVSPARVWTVCYGETKNVHPDDFFTEAQCDEKLAARLVEFDQGIRPCFKGDMSDTTRAALISFAYWRGVAGTCRSIVAAKWNAGDRLGACYALTLDKYTRAGGVQFRGLVKRRQVERDFCLEGL